MLKHTDDDGELSVFASGDELLFACSKGHVWIVKAQAMSLARGAAPAQRGTRAIAPDLDALAKKFGPEFLGHINQDRR